MQSGCATSCGCSRGELSTASNPIFRNMTSGFLALSPAEQTRALAKAPTITRAAKSSILYSTVQYSTVRTILRCYVVITQSISRELCTVQYVNLVSEITRKSLTCLYFCKISSMRSKCSICVLGWLVFCSPDSEQGPNVYSGVLTARTDSGHGFGGSVRLPCRLLYNRAIWVGPNNT